MFENIKFVIDIDNDTFEREIKKLHSHINYYYQFFKNFMHNLIDTIYIRRHHVKKKYN